MALADLPGTAIGRAGLSLAVDWPAPALWPNCRTKWGPTAESASRAARLNVYALARLAGWREQAHRFPNGAHVTLTFLPAAPRQWDEAGAFVACAPLLQAIGDVLNIPPASMLMEPMAVDFSQRLGIVVVKAVPRGTDGDAS